MLRHGCGYALANAGHDTRAIQDWLGHRSRAQRAPRKGASAIGFVLPGDNLYATSSSLTYLVSAFFVA